MTDIQLLLLKVILIFSIFFSMYEWIRLQSKIYKIIKEKYPQEYEKLGKPESIKIKWGFQKLSLGYFALLRSAINFPDDPTLNLFIIKLRRMHNIILCLLVMFLILSLLNFF